MREEQKGLDRSSDARSDWSLIASAVKSERCSTSVRGHRGQKEGDREKREARRRPLAQPRFEALEEPTQGKTRAERGLRRDDRVAFRNARETIPPAPKSQRQGGADHDRPKPVPQGGDGHRL